MQRQPLAPTQVPEPHGLSALPARANLRAAQSDNGSPTLADTLSHPFQPWEVNSAHIMKPMGKIGFLFLAVVNSETTLLKLAVTVYLAQKPSDLPTWGHIPEEAV